MRNFKTLTAQTVQKVPRNGLTSRKANAVHKSIKMPPMCRQLSEHALNLFVLSHIAIKNQIGFKFFGKLCGSVLEPLTHVTQSDLSALVETRPGHAIGDGAVREHASDQEFLAT